MAINPKAVGEVGTPARRAWNSTDALLYALGVGAGVDDLRYATENTRGIQQRVLPTFAVVIGGGGIPMEKMGSFDETRMVHGSQSIELHGEIPSKGEIESTGRISAIWDKRQAAVVEVESESRDLATGNPLLKLRSTLFMRGEGGWGGQRGPSQRLQMPDSDPTHRVVYQTSSDQALLYRLSGDRNPLHSDPSFAREGGFRSPILHGLCTYGFTGRALLKCLCPDDPGRFRAMAGRFSSPVFPGDSLVVEMWVDGGKAFFRTQNQHGESVLDQGVCTFE